MSKAIPKECMALLKEASEMFSETGCVPGIDGEEVPAETISAGCQGYISETVFADVSSAYGRPAQAKAIFCRFTLASLPGYAAPQPPLWLPARLCHGRSAARGKPYGLPRRRSR